MTERKKRYWYVVLSDICEKLPDIKVRQLRDVIVNALKKNVHYASIMTKDGINRAKVKGHKPDDITDDEWIKVFDENGELDLEETANKVVREFLVSGVILSMRYEDEMYDVVTDGDKSWIDGILKGEDDE